MFKSAASRNSGSNSGCGRFLKDLNAKQFKNLDTMKLTAKYTIDKFKTKDGSELRIFNAVTGDCMIKIYIDGEIEFTYSNQSFGSSELIEIANLANSAHLLLK